MPQTRIVSRMAGPPRHCVVARLTPSKFPSTTMLSVTLVVPLHLSHVIGSYVALPSVDKSTLPNHASLVGLLISTSSTVSKHWSTTTSESDHIAPDVILTPLTATSTVPSL